jgi:Rrf2 family protein
MFNVSTKTQYGLRALVRLAQSNDEGMCVADIAQLEGISPKYLEGIAGALRSSGLVISHRGKNGGYRLARPATDISMLEIITALEGSIVPVACCESGQGCTKSSACLPSRFWNGLKERIDAYLRDTSLADLQAQG